MIGKLLKTGIFGESHGSSVGAYIENFPQGVKVDERFIQEELVRRKPGQGNYTTRRKEEDRLEILSGVFRGNTSGMPIAAIVRNLDCHSSDYEDFTRLPRPGHADYPSILKFRENWDNRGSGFSSGRLTAGWVIAGALCKLALKRFGTDINAEIVELGGTAEKKKFSSLLKKTVKARDSIGARIKCTARKVPHVLGKPIGGIDSELGEAMFNIPGVRGFAIGTTKWKGSENNDPFTVNRKGEISTWTNNCGGVLGGMTFGNPLEFFVDIKPTPSIGIRQETIDMNTKKPAKLEIKGRHDPCIAIRAIPVVEAMCAMVILDNILRDCLWTSKK